MRRGVTHQVPGMFEAKPHRLLVPYDGSFEARKAPTEPPRKEDWKERLEKEVKGLADAQYRLFADGRLAMLIVVQALDAAGKDGVIRHVFSGVNPSGLHVAAFKQPSRREVAHDFLWRTTACLPERGAIAVFNRSYYEEVLVARVHPELLAAQRLSTTPSATFWETRLRAIRDHEQHLAEQGTVILKFWLNVSKREQRERLLERIDEPDKHWKFNSRDVDERERWDDYLDAYEQALNATSRPWAPWYVVPADEKPYLRWQVAKLVNETFDALDLEAPRSDEKRQAELERAKERLLAERD
jgi:PPK2 family polyphosphate:nucleotide phosphotransferase